MNGLLDFAQSASNAAGDVVAGPVDMLSALMMQLGLPIQEPIGGTKWQKRMGLRRDVEQGLPRAMGETVGLLSPVAVAARYPMMGNGLLR